MKKPLKKEKNILIFFVGRVWHFKRYGDKKEITNLFSCTNAS